MNRSYKEYPGLARVTFTLQKEQRDTMLILQLKVIEDFPSNILEFKRQSAVEGRKYFLQQRLKSYLTSTSRA